MGKTELTLSRADIEREIERLAPFHHDIELPFGLRTYLPDRARREGERTRMSNFMTHAWPAVLDRCGGNLDQLRVLDIACNCGGFSVAAAQCGAAEVLGVDIVDRYIEQADFVKRALKLSNVNFEKLDLNELAARHEEPFDLTFCLGILYHLENPIQSMRAVSSVTRRILVVDTKLTPGRASHPPRWVMKVVSAADQDSTDATSSLWRTTARCQFTPNAAAVLKLFEFLGFDQVEHVRMRGGDVEPRYRKGQRGVFIGVRSGKGG